MATWDSDDLLARVKVYMRRPSSDTAWTDANLFSLLTEAEARWVPILAAHDPGPMLSAPVLLTSADSGLTYPFPTALHYYHTEITPSVTGQPLVEGPLHSLTADYALEGTKIRMCRNTERSFADGPYLRGIASPVAITTSAQSVIKPTHHRIVLVYDALERWASVGGQMDPAYFAGLLQKAVYGDPQNPGDIGILGAMKARNPNHGMAGSTPPAYWRTA